MRAPVAILLPLAVGLAGCTAFDLGPQSEAAIAADAANPGYPRMLDIPPVPEDVRTAEDHGVEAEALVDRRRRLEQSAAVITSERPEPPEAPELPDDFVWMIPRGGE